MNGPPKEKPLLGGEGLPKRIERPYAAPPMLQGWQCEAARLFREFWRTGNQKHLRAFYTHIVAMRARRVRAMP